MEGPATALSVVPSRECGPVDFDAKFLFEDLVGIHPEYVERFIAVN